MEKKSLLLPILIFIIRNCSWTDAITPYLKEHKSWLDLFEIVVTSAQKPRSFFDDLRYLKVNPADGTMTNVEAKLVPGVYQGGSATVFTRD